ncbi:MAG TPA: hypothetical protein PK285_03115, partial [Bacteroidales bacterium]|nr:hypothetical protein [Bacteroidales bacterium]
FSNNLKFKTMKNIISIMMLTPIKHFIMKRTLFRLIPLLIVFFGSCTKDEIIEPSIICETKNYLHISHTRTDSNPFMNSIVERVDFSKFNMLWLGGDLAHLTSQDDYTMSHVDSIFDIGNINTLWALGNHDYSDLDRNQNFTNRPPFYSFHNDGITLIVLDTQDSLSNIIGAQKEFFEGIVDTIQESSHLIILHHKLIWMYGNTYLEPLIPSISNGGLGDCFYCINPNNFYTDIYPKLLEVQQKGIKVLCIGGDIGFHIKEFEYITSDGIYFLASGISSDTIDNKALLFHHDITNKQLTWEYKLISDL